MFEISEEAKKSLNISLEYLTKLEPYVAYYKGGEKLNLQLSEIRNRIANAMMNLNDNPKQALEEANKISKDLTSIYLFVTSTVIPGFTDKDINSVNDELYSLASNRVTRWFKRYWLELVGGRDKTIRQEVDKNLNQSRTAVDKLMDSLEQRNPTMAETIEGIYNFVKEISSAYGKMAELADIYNSITKIQRSEKRRKGKKYFADIIPQTDIYLLKRMEKSLSEYLGKINSYKVKADELEKRKGELIV